jgi:hypothetical protein
MAAQKTILVTTFSKNGETETEYGHYNAVDRKRKGWKMTSQKMYLCKMSEETFFNHAEDRKEI